MNRPRLTPSPAPRPAVRVSWPAALAALSLAVLGATLPARALEEPAVQAPGTIELRPTAPPADAARRRLGRWSRTWTGEWSKLSGPYRHLVAVRRAGRPLAGLGACEALGRGLLALDRDRLFPVPAPAVDRHLRRALDRLVGAAVECLRDRPHAAGHALDQARRAFGAAHRALARYRVNVSGLSTDP